MSKDVVLNSFRRTGNTFLSTALELSYFANNVDWQSYKINSHMHNLFLHRIPQSSNFYQVTLLRNPEDTIISNALYDGKYTSTDMFSEKSVESLCNQTVISYNRFYTEWLNNKNSKMILFENLVNNVNLVLSSIYSDLGLSYDIEISSADVLDNVGIQDLKRNEGVFAGHTPRGSKDTPEYESVKKSLAKIDQYNESLSIYKKILEALN
jgi:hypothetical protein